MQQLWGNWPILILEADFKLHRNRLSGKMAFKTAMAFYSISSKSLCCKKYLKILTTFIFATFSFAQKEKLSKARKPGGKSYLGPIRRCYPITLHLSSHGNAGLMMYEKLPVEQLFFLARISLLLLEEEKKLKLPLYCNAPTVEDDEDVG